MGLAYMDRQVLPLFVESIKTDLHITDVQFSLLTGLAFSLFYATCGLPIGRLIDSVSRTRILGLGIAAWSAATMLTGLSSSFAGVFLARMAVGVGESTVSPASQSMVTDAYLGGGLARAVSTVSLGVGLGSGGALLLGGFLARVYSGLPAITLIGGHPLHAWQFVFLVLGAPGLLLAPLFLFGVKDPARRRVIVLPDGRVARTSVVALFRFILEHRLTVGVSCLGYAVFTLATGVLSAWAPAHFIRTFHLPTATVGMSLGVSQMVGTTGALIFAGRWIDRRLKASRVDAGIRFSRAAAALAILPLALFPFMPTFLLGLLLVFAAQALCGAGYATVALVHQQLMPNQMRAQFSATYLIFSNLVGGMIAPTLVAWVNASLFHSVKYIGFAAAGVGASGLIVTVILLSLSLRPFRSSLQRVDSITAG